MKSKHTYATIIRIIHLCSKSLDFLFTSQIEERDDCLDGFSRHEVARRADTGEGAEGEERRMAGVFLQVNHSNTCFLKDVYY